MLKIFSALFILIFTIGFGQEKGKEKEKEKIIDAITITAASNQKMKSGLEKTAYQIKSNNTVAGGTGVDVIRNIPSIAIDAQGNIAYRGTTGFVLQLNGKNLQMDPATFLAQLSANDVQEIQVISTPSAKNDSEGKAGIINVVTKQNRKNFSALQINLKGGLPSIEDYDNNNTARRYGADLVYALQKNKWEFSLGANYNRNDLSGRREGYVWTQTGNVQTHFPSLGERSFKNTNYATRFNLGYTIDSTQTISLGAYLGKQTKDRTADIVYFNNHRVNLNNPGVQYGNFQYFNHNLQTRTGDFAIVSLDYAKKFKNKSSLETSFLYEHTLLGGPTSNQNLGFPDNTLVYQDEYNSNTNPLNGFRFQTDYKFRPFSFGTLEIGYQFKKLDHKGDFLYQRRNLNNGNWELVPEFSSEVNLFRNSHAVYAQISKSANKWEYNVGLRGETLSRDFQLKDKANTINKTYTYEFNKLFPSASFLYKFNPNQSLKAGYSKRVEHTTTFKMNPFPEREHSETLEQGDAELLPEFIDLAELGYNTKINKVKLFTTGYFRNVKNLINRVNTVYNDTILNRIYSNVGNAKTFGLEAGIDFKNKKVSLFASGNVYHTSIKGSFRGDNVDNNAWMFNANLNLGYQFTDTLNAQFNFNYLSKRITAQGEDSEYYLPSLAIKKSFFNNSLVATLQWQNIDMGLLKTNEQRISTWKPNSFYTTTNYIQEVDMVVLNISYTINTLKTKFIDSEFGKQEF